MPPVETTREVDPIGRQFRQPPVRLRLGQPILLYSSLDVHSERIHDRLLDGSRFNLLRVRDLGQCLAGAKRQDQIGRRELERPGDGLKQIPRFAREIEPTRRAFLAARRAARARL